MAVKLSMCVRWLKKEEVLGVAWYCLYKIFHILKDLGLDASLWKSYFPKAFSHILIWVNGYVLFLNYLILQNQEFFSETVVMDLLHNLYSLGLLL